MDQLGIIIKASRPVAFASLIRIVGDFDLAEEAIQEAIYRAVIDWQEKRIPENPVAWLVQTGRRFAIDVLRHTELEQRHRENVAALPDRDILANNDTEISVLQLHDDQLRLIFTCCHPALSVDAQVALSLKTIAGLSLEEIARAYLLPVKTLEQRITRAKRKIRDAAIPYKIPGDDQIVFRLEAVMSTIYLIYNQAYTTFRGADLLDCQLSEAAIYLAHMLNRLIRGHREAQGLLALMLLQHARAGARVDSDNLPIPLEEQNRQLWNQPLIDQGTVLVEKCLSHNTLGPYQLQAAIAAVHCNAKKPGDTDWQKIVSYYQMLESCIPSPVTTLNRAVAIARLQGAAQGLALLDSLEHNSQMKNFQYYHSSRAGLLQEIGQFAGALAAFQKAYLLCENEAEKKYLVRKIEKLQQ